MKVFVVFSCALAAAAAGIIAPIGPIVVAGPQHLPVIGPNGVPIDTPAVQHARAAHLAHKVEAHARNGDLSLVAHGGALAYAHQHAITTPIVAAHAAHGIVAHVGIPETAEVVAAKKVHFAAHAEALARNGHIASIHHILRRGIAAVAHAVPAAWPTTLGLPAITSNVVPVWAQSAVAVPVAIARANPAAWPTTLGLPAVTSNGVPLETPEVVAAKSSHFAAHAEALARTGQVYGIADAPILAHATIATPVPIARAIPAAWPTTLGLPAVTANGIPLETPEVIAAKSNHFSAHAEALARNSPIISEGVIATPIASLW